MLAPATIVERRSPGRANSRPRGTRHPTRCLAVVSSFPRVPVRVNGTRLAAAKYGPPRRNHTATDQRRVIHRQEIPGLSSILQARHAPERSRSVQNRHRKNGFHPLENLPLNQRVAGNSTSQHRKAAVSSTTPRARTGFHPCPFFGFRALAFLWTSDFPSSL